MIPRRSIKLIFGLLLISGFSSLVYEVTWMRMLALAFGVSIYAATAVLTAYMGGMALGSWLFGRWVTRRAANPERPLDLLKVYALLELGIGVFAVLAPLMFKGLTGLYVWIARQYEPGFYAYNLIRFGLSALVLLIPTALMGGTIPIISHMLARSEQKHGRDLGNLYAINTLGGVLGTFFTGLFLIRLLGTSTTIYLAALLDLLVALLAFSSSGERPETPRKSDEKQARSGGKRHARTPAPIAAIAEGLPTAGQVRLVLVGFAVSGFAALGYEVVWTRLLSIYSLNAIFSFSIMLTTFLIGLAVGSSLAARWVDRAGQPVKIFGLIQLGIGLLGIIVLYLFSAMGWLRDHFISGSSFTSQVIVEFFSAIIIMLLPTILMGAAYPVAARVYTTASQQVGLRVGRLYALNTLGSTLGSIVAGFILISFVGLQRSGVILAGVNLLLGVIILFSLNKKPYIALAGAAALAVVGILMLPKGVYLGLFEGRPSNMIYYKEGVDATVSVFQTDDGKLKVSFVDGRSEVPTDSQSMQAFHLLGHLPALLKPGAQNVLMVSFGNGIASGSMSQHGFSSIEAVELVKEQVEVAELYRPENHAVLDYPGLDITIEDGRNYLLRTDKTYDIVTVDATHPINTSSWALFTKEFYDLIRKRLASDGVVIQWLPFHDLAERDYRTIIHTFQSVFPHTTLWYTSGIHTFMVGTPEPLTKEQILALDGVMQQYGVEADLGSAEELAKSYLMDESQVAQYTAGYPVITDDRAFFVPALQVQQIIQGFLPYANP